jgi:tRNA U34 5-methylaminomethyl-2-thiouridine-forming methyltransferase MnmC
VETLAEQRFNNHFWITILMEKVKTGDGSFTFLNPEYGEVYHSVSGAEEEAIEKYANPLGLSDLAKKGEVWILDVCFGLGYNTAAALDKIWNSNPSCKVHVVGLEIDKSLEDRLGELKPSFKSYPLILGKKDGRLDLKILYGDARETILKIKDKFDVCFFDPFSPRKQPEMWNEKFLKDVGERIKLGGKLSTYSCATHVRINLVRAGFDVKDGPAIGRRAPSTIAVKVV